MTTDHVTTGTQTPKNKRGNGKPRGDTGCYEELRGATGIRFSSLVILWLGSS